MIREARATRKVVLPCTTVKPHWHVVVSPAPCVIPADITHHICLLILNVIYYMSYIYIYIYIYFYTYMTNLRKMTLPIAFIPSCLGPRFKISGDPSVLMPCAPCDRTRWPSTEPLPHASLAQGSLDLAFAGFVPQQLRYSIWPPVFLFFLISLEGFVRVFN